MVDHKINLEHALILKNHLLKFYFAKIPNESASLMASRADKKVEWVKMMFKRSFGVTNRASKIEKKPTWQMHHISWC